MLTRMTLLVLALSLTSGCSWLCGDVVSKQTVRDMKAQTDEILPQYIKYVDADAEIQGVTKRTRLRDAKQLDATITEAAK